MAPTDAPSGIPIGEHPIPERHAYTHDNRLLLTIVAALLVGLTIVAVAAYGPPSNSESAREKASQLQLLWRQEGLPAPDISVLSSSLGTDGGSACTSGGGYPLAGAIFDQQVAAGAAATRPLPIESQLLNGQLAILHVYCPSQVPAFVARFHTYKLYDLAGT